MERKILKYLDEIHRLNKQNKMNHHSFSQKEMKQQFDLIELLLLHLSNEIVQIKTTLLQETQCKTKKKK